ncbi:TIGR00282 family metallophosphoesterase [Treponema sp. OMZ 855]|uniref:TIGR00282 family metallophosphoesterase n=1 Tax=Treponema sp. OMZ 855 TaxID=1643512 RepID=UPI0020A4C410|nr:TIGR00282 family metallophosphoesterase [Treponema sp. OMZ 855]UTC51592.1 YmdB family metallophosphoesterase [Treponema sp. OMZ 855]
MRIFYIAEITGKAGVWVVRKNIAEIKRRYQPDFIIANAGMATGAGGLGKQHAGYLRKMGIDCITGGDCIFQKKDLVENLPNMPFVLRPCNLPEYSSGAGYRYFTARNGEKLAVISILGRVGHHRLLADNPFALMQALLPKIERETPFIVADFSSTATAEKQTMAFFLAGRLSALIGSGTGAAAADERLMSAESGFSGTDAADALINAQTGAVEAYCGQHGRKTAYITDAGRTGSFDSVGGHAPSGKIREYRTGLFEYPQETWQRVCVQGLDIELDGAGGALSIERVRIEMPAAAVPQSS